MVKIISVYSVYYRLSFLLARGVLLKSSHINETVSVVLRKDSHLEQINEERIIQLTLNDFSLICLFCYSHCHNLSLLKTGKTYI